MRLPLLGRLSRRTQQDWDSGPYLWIDNISNEHVLLRLPSGDLRLDRKCSLRFRPDVLDLPQIQALIAADKLVVRQ